MLQLSGDPVSTTSAIVGKLIDVPFASQSQSR